VKKKIISREEGQQKSFVESKDRTAKQQSLVLNRRSRMVKNIVEDRQLQQ
jgi:hypothetical protein